MRILTIITTLLTLSTSLIAQHSGPVQWLSIDEAYKKYEENPKPIFIDVYTDWCGWCKRMDATTFQDMEIANYLNTYFYPVKLDAETKEKINFKGRVYENSQYQKGKSMLDSLVNLQNITTTELSKINKQKDSTNYANTQNKLNGITNQANSFKKRLGRTSHDFAIELLRGQMSYPSLIFLFDSLKSNMPAKGALKPNQLAPLMVFINEQTYKTTKNVSEFQNLFNQSFNQTPTNNVNWVDFNTASKMQKEGTTKKKILIQLYHESNISSLMMIKGTYEDPNIAKYVNDNFIPVKINIQDTTSYIYNNNKFGVANNFNQFALALMDNKIQVPYLAIIDESGNLTMKIPQFFEPQSLDGVLKYINASAYLEMSYAEWIKKQQQ